ncbi:hypothetical protein O6H91_02G044100 [Diphasiastrum complanatum]|uniref:Uncharacterized protein n=1 Tax=Diphasiastrum complanatum TaxID=34168 RepID=A0ACC2EET4_DIPCM|nr:hypothetical protein O6H91_02G044100 [Diphasiastrum complanatum]
MGVVRLRLARFGRKNLPFYRIFAADSRAPRDGKHLEVVGFYNPLPGKDGMKRIGIRSERIKYWLSVGAQPSDTVARLLHKIGLLPPRPVPHVRRKAEDAKVLASTKFQSDPPSSKSSPTQ